MENNDNLFNENMTAETAVTSAANPDGEVDTETGEIIAGAAAETPDKKKRVRRGKEEMAAARKQEEDAIRDAFFKELQAKGLIRREDELSDAENPNLELYNRLRKVPDYACKPITDGPLQGKTDINPMLRIKQLTALFGPAGRGFYTRVTEREVITDKLGRQMVHVAVDLYVKYEDGWSQPIQGIGGSPLMSRTGSLDDDAFKKAETDAISVACKKLGMCADVYFAADASYGTKYESGGVHAAEAGSGTMLDKVINGKAVGAVIDTCAEEKPAASPATSAPETKAPAKETAAPATPPVSKPEGPKLGLSGKSAAPAPAGTLPSLVKDSESWWTIVTYISTLPDTSATCLENVKKGYRRKIAFSDELWKELLETAGVTAAA